MTELSLTVLSGLAGSGKTTLARQLSARTDAMVVSRDDMRKFLEILDESELTLRLVQLAVSFLRNDISVIVDSQNLHPADRVRWTELARLANAKLYWIHLDVPVEVCIARDAKRPVPNGEATIRTVAALNAVQLLKLSKQSGVQHGR